VRHLQANAWGDVAFAAGYAVPIVSTATLWTAGAVAHDRVTLGAASAAIQAALVTLATTGALKLAVGRSYPLHGGDPSAPDRLDHPEYARDARPFQNGLGAWPSGHTSTTIAVAAALTAYAPEELWIPAIGYPLGLAIGAGMIDRDSHWASDVMAGALIGHAIGYSIGKSFRERVRSSASQPSTTVDLRLVPLADVPYGQGMALRGTW
jgi:membrane-associated phospholipid phosphatase